MFTRTLPIGYLAKKTGTTVETIRLYEKIGLLPKPGRTRGNYRSYTQAHLVRLSFIRRARDLGFSLEEVRSLLLLSDDRDQPRAAIDTIASKHRAEVELKMRDLQALKAELDKLIDQCGNGNITDCKLIESLSPEPGDSGLL